MIEVQVEIECAFSSKFLDSQIRFWKLKLIHHTKYLLQTSEELLLVIVETSPLVYSLLLIFFTDEAIQKASYLWKVYFAGLRFPLLPCDKIIICKLFPGFHGVLKVYVCSRSSWNPEDAKRKRKIWHTWLELTPYGEEEETKDSWSGEISSSSSTAAADTFLLLNNYKIQRTKTVIIFSKFLKGSISQTNSGIYFVYWSITGVNTTKYTRNVLNKACQRKNIQTIWNILLIL